MDKTRYSADITGSFYLKSKRKEKYSLQPSASLTVESAFVFPFFFLAIVILVLFLDLYRIQSVIQASLSQSSRELGMYAYCESADESSPVGTVSSAVCKRRIPASDCRAQKRHLSFNVLLSKWTDYFKSHFFIQKPCQFHSTSSNPGHHHILCSCMDRL